MVRFNHKNLLCLQRCNHSQSYLSSISNRPFPVLKDTLDPASPESVKAIGVSKTASEELNLLKKVFEHCAGKKIWFEPNQIVQHQATKKKFNSANVLTFFSILDFDIR